MIKFPKSFTVRESLGAIIWNFVGMAFSLVTGVITARILAPDQRGFLALFLIISSLSYLFSSLGTNTAIRTFQPREEWATFRTYFQVSSALAFGNIIISLLILFIFSAFGFLDVRRYVFFVVLLSFVTFVSSQLLDVLNAVGKIRHSAFSNISGHFVTMLILIVFFAFFPDAGLQGASAAYIAGFATRVLVSFILIKSASLELGAATSAGRRRLLRGGLSFWGMGLGQTMTFRADQLMLGALSTPSQMGFYAVATTPASLMQVVSNSIGQVAFRQAATQSLTRRGLLNLLGVGSGITSIYVIVLWLTAPVVIPFIFGSDYMESVSIVRILLIAELFLSPYLILVRALAGMNQPRWSSSSGFVGLIVLVPLLFYLVPLYGAQGAALGTVIGYAAMFIFALIGITIANRRNSAF